MYLVSGSRSFYPPTYLINKSYRRVGTLYT